MIAIAPQLKRWRGRGLIFLAVWALLIMTWAAMAPLSGAAVGMGAFKVDADRKAVTHRDGGIVAAIHVREGEVVKSGQLLVTLEDARIDASVDLLQAQLDGEQLRESRLAAEAGMRERWLPGPALKAPMQRAPGALAREQAAFGARRSALEAQLASARSQAADTDKEIEAHLRNLKSAAESSRLANEELASNEALLKENFVNRTRVMTLQRAVSEYASRSHTVEAELAQARQHRAELSGRQATLRQSYVQASTDDLREASARIVDLQARLRAATDTSERQRVLAPVAGRLVDLRVNTPGSAVGPREHIVDIVPEGVPMLVEVRLAADSVSGVHVGQSADIHLPGHVFRHFGNLQGRVTNISADALTEARSGMPYFTVLVAPGPEALAKLQREGVGPGVAAEVFINTSRRSPLEFLFDPMGSALRRAFRDQ